uniref:Uncharacterized protein n=1 Tax=Lygus hesperus TaxID=30085 RepID=A0A0K8TDK9_LYGHE
MSSGEGNKDDNYRKELEEWSSDGECQGSEDNNYWRSDIDWNGDGSSMAGEASGVSEATEEEQPDEEEEEEEEERRKKKKQKKREEKGIKPKKKFDVDDVGTDDDSRPLDDATEKSDKVFKSNFSEMTDISDIEDQISEAHSKFAEDKQSLSSVIGLVDEVTLKGRNLAKRASETSVALDKEILNKANLMEMKLKILENGDTSDDVLLAFGGSRNCKGSSLERDTPGRIEYIESDEDDSDYSKDTKEGIGNERRDDDSSIVSKSSLSRLGSMGSGSVKSKKVKDRGSIVSSESTESSQQGEVIDQGEAVQRNDSDKGASSCQIPCSSGDESCTRNLQVENSDNEETVVSAEQSASSDSDISQTSKRRSTEECQNNSMALDEEYQDDSITLDLQKDPSGNSMNDYGSERSSRDSPEYDEPECCTNECHKHKCCFIYIGGGGDDGGREAEIINRLKKLRDDIANMREELSLARTECKKESEEVAKLIEETIARNKAAEQQEESAIAQSSTLVTPPKTPPANAFPSYILEETRGRDQSDSFNQQLQQGVFSKLGVYSKQHQLGVFNQQPLMTRAKVPIPTAVLEDRLRATRQTASTSYRESLQQLERMVEKEMASIQDSMTRLEPLNKMAAEWDNLQNVRSRSMTFMRDYRMEMVTAEMRLQSEKNLQNQSIEIN